jgi:prepilin-type N-terminal cleavage/methylation domain-containing protein
MTMRTVGIIMRPAFTLVETIAVILVLGVLSVVTTPLILSAGDAFGQAALARERTEDASMALERIVRALREAPDQSGAPGTPDITTATATSIEFADGTEIELLGTTLWLALPGEAAAPVCQHVTAFELTYLNAGGGTITVSSPTDALNANRLHIRLAPEGGAELRTSVFLRCTLGGA